MPELNNKRWEQFARNRATGMPNADAYLGAGYNTNSLENAGKYASQMQLRHPEIKARITEIEDELRENALKRAEVDREYVLKGLIENHERAAQVVEVVDRQGAATGTFTYQGTVANRSLELLGKELGMLVERFSIESLDSELEGMSSQELRAFVKTAATEVGLRVVEMNRDELRSFIVRTAPGVGLRVEESREGAGGAEAEEAGGVSAVPEASGVPPARRH